MRTAALKQRAKYALQKACPHAHCENCPLAWEERCMEDYDTGCLIYEDLYEGSPCCYLPLFMKRLYKRHRERKREKYEAKAWDGMAEWMERTEKQHECMREALETEIPGIDTSTGIHVHVLERYQNLCVQRGLTIEVPAKQRPKPKTQISRHSS